MKIIFLQPILQKKWGWKCRFKISLKYAVTGLSINQYIGSALVTVALSSTIQKLVQEEKDLDLDLKISNPEKKDLIIPFEKKICSWLSNSKTDILQRNDQKNGEIEFYNFFQHLQKFCFVWEHLLINFRYSMELSTKKMTTSKVVRKKLFVDQSRIWNLEEPATGVSSNMTLKRRSILMGYMWHDVSAGNLLNIRRSFRNLPIMGLTEKKTTFLETIVGTIINK